MRIKEGMDKYTIFTDGSPRHTFIINQFGMPIRLCVQVIFQEKIIRMKWKKTKGLKLPMRNVKATILCYDFEQDDFNKPILNKNGQYQFFHNSEGKALLQERTIKADIRPLTKEIIKKYGRRNGNAQSKK